MNWSAPRSRPSSTWPPPPTRPRSSTSPNNALGLDAHAVEHEGLDERFVLPRVVAARGAAVSGAHVGAQQHQPAPGLAVAQFGHPLGRLPVTDTRVVESAPRQDGRVVL